jgi:HAD superfamily hydrolase (TIGR01509 family)
MLYRGERMIEAIIFDLDGLLVDSEPCWDEARRLMAAEAGKTWADADHQACMGVDTLTWARYMIDRLELKLSTDEVIDRIVGTMRDIYARGIPYMPGAVEAVALAAAHYPVGLASGSHRSLIDAVTADAALRGKLQAVVCADEMPAGKPAPDVYLAAARLLGVQPANCICLEDSGSGILSGVAAGMKVIAVPDPRFPPAAHVLAQAACVLPDLRAFDLEIVRGLGGA